ncbi:MAG: acyltransferase family protein [Lachnospiraceae bacterium]|nr:acyltransferase family protein [Lachnospiraceae bacterium]
MSEKRDKSNKKFMLLSAIGIFMVVDHHTFTAFNILGDFLPYNSFFMPMFVFISGYFNKVDASTNLWSYFVKKVKTLLVPYIGLSFTVFTIQQLISYIKLGNEMTPLPSGYLSYVLNRIITVGSYGVIVEPMWFVIALFFTLIVYAVLKKFLYKIWNSYIMFVLFCGLQIFTVYLAKNADMGSLEYLLVPLKALFFFPFIELGIIYREHLEKKHTAMSGTGKIALMFILLVINTIRTVYMPAAYDIAFDSIDELAGFTSPYFITPLISAIIGILFWTTFADLVGKQVYESRFVNFMSCNTFWIMGLHIIFYNIFNCLLMGINNIVALPYFDVEAFKETEWYFWGISSNIKMLYVIVGILGPLGLKWIYDRICSFVNSRIEKAGSDQKVKTLKLVSKAAFVLVFALAVGLVILLTGPKTEEIEPDNPEAAYDEPDGESYGDADGLDIPAISDDIIDDGQTSSDTDDGTDNNGTPDTNPDNNTPPEDVTSAYAYIDIVYNYMGTNTDYLTEPYAITGNGTYTVTINRNDSSEADLAFDSLSYMGIRLLDDDTSDVDIKKAAITDVKVNCDGIQLTVDDAGSTDYADGVIYDFFDCYDPDGNSEAVYDFSSKNTIEISFTITGAKIG